jgi:hypothetical protein
MRHTTIILAAALLLLPAAAAKAQSQGTNGNGNICSSVDGTAANHVLRSTYGINNSSTTTTLEVFCPVNALPLSGSPTTFVARVYNRNSGTALSCTVYQLTTDGTTVHSFAQTATGSLNSPVQTLTWTIPASGAGGSGSLVQSNNMVVDCTIPPLSSGQYSAIASFGWSP